MKVGFSDNVRVSEYGMDGVDTSSPSEIYAYSSSASDIRILSSRGSTDSMVIQDRKGSDDSTTCSVDSNNKQAYSKALSSREYRKSILDSSELPVGIDLLVEGSDIASSSFTSSSTFSNAKQRSRFADNWTEHVRIDLKKNTQKFKPVKYRSVETTICRKLQIDSSASASSSSSSSSKGKHGSQDGTTSIKASLSSNSALTDPFKKLAKKTPYFTTVNKSHFPDECHGKVADNTCDLEGRLIIKSKRSSSDPVGYDANLSDGDVIIPGTPRTPRGPRERDLASKPSSYMEADPPYKHKRVINSSMNKADKNKSSFAQQQFTELVARM